MVKNKRHNNVQEATGIRVVSMFVKEFFKWGLQLYDQENDDGIDGFIQVRDNMGNDLGTKIQVQIKSGPSYYKGTNNKGQLKLQPYSNKQRLNEHLEIYAKQVEPTILIYVTTEWKGKKDMYRPWAWWVRMDNYAHDGTSYVYIDSTKRFGEHSKKELYSLVSNSLKWTECKTINSSLEDCKLFYTTGNIKEEAKSVYDTLRKTEIFCPALNTNVVFNRIGWRHITNGARGRERIRNSFGLMSVVPQIIRLSEKCIYASKSKNANDSHIFYTLRANVIFKKETMKVQVIIRRQKKSRGEFKYVFYSVHIMNK